MERNTGKSYRRRSWLLAGCCAMVFLLPACSANGNLNILGYSTAPNYDRGIKTIQVQMIKDATMWRLVPVVGLEEHLTEAIVREIERVTPWKVVQSGADTELVGIIRSLTLTNTVYNQLNERREGQATLVVELRWRDLRTGEILSKPAPRAVEGETSSPPLLPGQVNPLALAAGLPNAQTPISTPDSPLSNTAPATFQDGAANQPVGTAGAITGEPPPPSPTFGGPKSPPGVFVRSNAYFRPELGQSLTSAQKQAVDGMATQIVSLMEKGW